MKKLILFLYFMPVLLKAQLHDNIWLMGYKGAVDSTDEFGITQISFSTGNISIAENHYLYGSFSELNTVYSDSFGNPIAVFNGNRINDRSWQKMKGGDSIKYKLDPNPFVFGYSSDQDIPQGGIFLPWPGRPDSLLLFYVSQGNAGTPAFVELASLHLQYALIRLSGNNGLGEVVERRHVVLEDTIQYGRLSTCKHANGRDWWLMINEINTNRWYRFLLDPFGLHFLGQQEIGMPMIDGFGMSVYSPDGNHYAVYNGIGLHDGAYLDVYDFNRCDGFFENHQQIFFPIGTAGGVAISPNSNYLYLSKVTQLYQYDLKAADLAASQILVDVYDGYVNTSSTTFDQAQLAPDNKIYISVYGSTKVLHVIHYPDEPGTACGFKQHSIQLPVYNAESLTSSPFFRLGPLDGSPCDTLGLDNRPVAFWRSERDTLEPLRVYFHDLSYYEPATWLWDFGDGTAGSTARHPEHTFPGPGEYEVCLTVSNANATHTLCRTLTFTSAAVENPDITDQISVGPNPFSNELSVALSIQLRSPVFRLYDQMGRLVRAQALAYGITEVEVGNLPKGLYFWEVRSGGELVKVGKAVKGE